MRAALATVLSLAAGAAGTAGAQERLTLTGDDTWLVAERPGPDTPEGRLAEARTALAAGRAHRARTLADRWIEGNPEHPLLPQAYLLRGDALSAEGDHYKALFDYEHIARIFPASEAFVTALERELDIATMYARGMKRKLLGLPIIETGDEAEELLTRIQERMPGSTLAERAALELADFYFQQQKMELAAEMYSIFLENFPKSLHTGFARVRLIGAHLATFKGPEFDAAGLREARAGLEELKAVEPATAERKMADSLLSRIRESEARKQLVTARWYFRTGDAVAAELTVRRLLASFPATAAAAEAVDLGARLVPRLTPSVLAGAPDYAALRRALRESSPEGTGAPGAADPGGARHRDGSGP